MKTDPASPPALRVLFHLPAVGGVMVMVAAMVYCWLNAAGHSALDLRGGWVVFGPLTLIGVGLLVRGERRAGWFTVATGVLGMAFGYFAHHLGIMQEYNHWASHGLEPKNPHAAWWLVAFGIGSVVVLGIAMTGCRAPASVGWASIGGSTSAGRP